MFLESIYDRMAEWSKATHLSCVLFGGEGSNPSSVNLSVCSAIHFNFALKPLLPFPRAAGSKPAWDEDRFAQPQLVGG